MPNKTKFDFYNHALRRGFLKQLTLGVSALTFVKFSPLSQAQIAGSLPAVTSLLLEDEVPECAAAFPCDQAFSLSLNYVDSVNNTIDVDLEMITPGGSRIAPKGENGVLAGNCGLVHQGDETSTGTTATETITKSAGANPSLGEGKYQIFARSNTNSASTISLHASMLVCNIGTGLGATLAFAPLEVKDIGSIDISSGGSMSYRLFSFIHNG